MWQRWSHGSGPITEDFIGGENISVTGDAMTEVMSQVFRKPWEKLSTKTVEFLVATKMYLLPTQI